MHSLCGSGKGRKDQFSRSRTKTIMYGSHQERHSEILMIVLIISRK